MPDVTARDLAWLFYSGVPWDKYTRAEQVAFKLYVEGWNAGNAARGRDA